MHPGSGPSNRHNDVYFPQIREHLLAAGIAVASFDKRGVGGSSGHWTDAGIVEQAVDATAALEHLADVGSARPVRPVRAQPGRVGRARGRGGWGAGGPGDHQLRAGCLAGRAGSLRAAASGSGGRGGRRRRSRPGSTPSTRWPGCCATVSGSTRRRRSSWRWVPTMAPGSWLLTDASGGSPARSSTTTPDRRCGGSTYPCWRCSAPMTRSSRSRRASRSSAPRCAPELLTVAVLPGGDHRVQTGDPPRLVDGYAATLIGFILDAAS